jgi:hypothetical protein
VAIAAATCRRRPRWLELGDGTAFHERANRQGGSLRSTTTATSANTNTTTATSTTTTTTDTDTTTTS